MGAGHLLGLGSSLPYKFESLRITEGHRPIGFRFSKHIINIQTILNGTPILACGEDNYKEVATAKAFSELFERAALYSPKAESIGILTSNGFASHPNKAEAEINAMFEVVERDAVLSNWYSQQPYHQISQSTLPTELRDWIKNELSRSEYPILKLLLSTEGLGPSVTCLLMNEGGFGVTGHASGLNLQSSISSAIAEACRSAHHALRMTYWSESLALKKLSSKVQPGAHAVFYAHHAPFPNWIFGQDLNFDDCLKTWGLRAKTIIENKNSFIFKYFLDEPVYTVLAKHSECIEISWGFETKESLGKRLSLKLNEKNINLEPHFVA